MNRSGRSNITDTMAAGNEQIPQEIKMRRMMKKKRSGWRPTAGNSLNDCYHQVDIRSSSGGHPTASGIGATRAGKPPGDGLGIFLFFQQHPVRRNPVGQCRQQSCNRPTAAVGASMPVAHYSWGPDQNGTCFVSPIRNGFSWFVNCSMLNQGGLRRGVQVSRPEEGAPSLILPNAAIDY